MPAQPPKLLDQVRDALRARHYPAHAEETSVAWITRFILFHGKRHPSDLAAPEVMAFLNSLASDAERGQARSAVLFLYRQVLGRTLDLPADAPPPSVHPLTPDSRPLPPARRPLTPDPCFLTPDLVALLDQTREALRVKHYAIRTEQAYVDWIRRFIRYHNQRHPRELGGAEVAAFLTYLAVDQHVAASTHLRSGPQRTALSLSRSYPPGTCLSHDSVGERLRSPRRQIARSASI